MSPENRGVARWLRKLNLSIRLWRRDRELWKLKERAERSRMLTALYAERWARDERFNRGNPLDRAAAERYENRTRELENEIESWKSQSPAPPEHSMLGQR